jgi:FixJ family two-component response regulator
MPIIFVTAFSEETIRARVLTNGALGYLSKPLQEQSLIECLEQALKRPVKISPENAVRLCRGQHHDYSCV